MGRTGLAFGLSYKLLFQTKKSPQRQEGEPGPEPQLAAIGTAMGFLPTAGITQAHSSFCTAYHNPNASILKEYLQQKLDEH